MAFGKLGELTAKTHGGYVKSTDFAIAALRNFGNITLKKDGENVPVSNPGKEALLVNLSKDGGVEVLS